MKSRYLHRIMYLQCLSFFHLIFWPSPRHEVITGCRGGWRGYGGCWLHDPPLAGLGPAEDGPRPRHRCEASARPGSWQQPPSWWPASDPWCGTASHNLARTRQVMAKMGLLHILLLILSASSYSVSGEHWGPAVVGEGYLFVGVLIKHTSQSWINVNLNFQLLFNCSLAWYFPYLVCGTKFKHCVKIAAWIKLLNISFISYWCVFDDVFRKQLWNFTFVIHFFYQVSSKRFCSIIQRSVLENKLRLILNCKYL